MEHISTVFSVVVGVGFVAMGLGMRIYCRRKRARCTIPHKAAVVDEKELMSQTLEYVVDGAIYRKTYLVQSYFFGSDGTERANVDIYMNPEKPEDIFPRALDNFLRVFSILPAVVGLLAIAIGILASYGLFPLGGA